MLLIYVGLISFGLSFFFALGGVGSAVALLPALMALGVPAGVARPVGLLVNATSLGGATYHNLKTGKFRPRARWLLIVFSLPAATAGAWFSSQIPQTTLLALFACFLLFSAAVIVFPFRKSGEKEREHCPPVKGALLGVASGMISGLLGVGGGGVIVPALHAMGVGGQQIAMVTAFSVTFSSFAGFMAYTAMGAVHGDILLAASASALAGGMLGTRVMHRIDQRWIRMVLAISLAVSGGRILWKLMG